MCVLHISIKTYPCIIDYFFKYGYVFIIQLNTNERMLLPKFIQRDKTWTHSKALFCVGCKRQVCRHLIITKPIVHLAKLFYLHAHDRFLSTIFKVCKVYFHPHLNNIFLNIISWLKQKQPQRKYALLLAQHMLK